MHRARAAALLVLFSFSLMPPSLFADARSNLPACCRHGGKHHCSMKSVATDIDAPPGGAINTSSTCPCYPKAAVGPNAANTGAAPLARAAIALVMRAAAAPELAETQYRISFSRGWQKRGPPSPLS